MIYLKNICTSLNITTAIGIGKRQSDFLILGLLHHTDLQHLVFPSDYSSRYRPGSTLLNFDYRTRTGILTLYAHKPRLLIHIVIYIGVSPRKSDI